MAEKQLGAAPSATSDAVTKSYVDTRVTTAGTYAARPSVSAVASGAIYMCNDIGDDYVSNGSAWKKLRINGMGNSLIAEPTTFTGSVTAGGGTFASDKGCRTLTLPGTGTSHNFEYQAITSNYTARAYIEYPKSANDENWNLGVVLYDSASGKNIIFGTTWNSGGFYIGAEKWNNTAGSWNSGYTMVALNPTIPTLYNVNWLQIRDDGTNRYFEYSINGVDWVTIQSVSRTDFCTPNYVGWGMLSIAYPLTVRCRSFAVS